MSLIAGVLSAIAVVVLWIAVNLFRAFHMRSGDGSGGIGLVIMDYQLYLAALLGFGLGFFWMFRRKQSAVRKIP